MKHLRRGNEETRRLLKELEIPAVPAAVENRLRRIYAELPGEMPQTYTEPAFDREAEGLVEVVPFEVKPMHRAVRGLLGACGAIAAAMVLLMGLNTVNPGFTESLPGLGGLFAKVNGKNPMGQNLDTYDDLEQVSQVALSNTDSGYKLTVDEAFCDGNYVYFTLEMECPEDAAEYETIFPYGGAGSLSQEDDPYAPAKYTTNGTVTGMESSGVTGSPKEGKIGLACALPVHGGEALENGQKVTVGMSIPALEARYGKGHEKRGTPDYIPVGFETEFEVTVNTSHNHISVGEGQDNGVSIKEVESTPGYIRLKVEVPVWGFGGEEVMNPGGIKGNFDNCHLYTEDGQELSRNSNFWDIDSMYFWGSGPMPQKGDTIQYTLGFSGAPEGCKKVVLRVFEYDLTTWVPGSPATDPESEKRGIFAELAINLETGEAVPSDTYLAEGHTKLDTEEYLNTPQTPDFSGGYFVTDCWASSNNMDYTVDEEGIITGVEKEENGWISGVQLYADVEEPDFELRFFKNGEQIRTLTVSPQVPHETVQIPGQDGTLLPAYCHKEENTYLVMRRLDPVQKEWMENWGYQTVPKWQIECSVTGPEPVPYVHEEGSMPHPDKVQLVDGKTGEVLIDDLTIASRWKPEA